MSSNPLATAIEDLRVEVENNTTVGNSAIAYIRGVPALIQAAVDAALAQGAEPAQLAAIVDLKNKLSAETQAFQDALNANTPPV